MMKLSLLSQTMCLPNHVFLMMKLQKFPLKVQADKLVRARQECTRGVSWQIAICICICKIQIQRANTKTNTQISEIKSYKNEKHSREICDHKTGVHKGGSGGRQKARRECWISNISDIKANISDIFHHPRVNSVENEKGRFPVLETL